MRQGPPSLPAIASGGFYEEILMWHEEAVARGAYTEAQILEEVWEIATDMLIEPEELM